MVTKEIIDDFFKYAKNKQQEVYKILEINESLLESLDEEAANNYLFKKMNEFISKLKENKLYDYFIGEGLKIENINSFIEYFRLSGESITVEQCKEVINKYSTKMDSYTKVDLIILTKDTEFIKECLKDESLRLNYNNKEELIKATKDVAFIKKCVRDESFEQRKLMAEGPIQSQRKLEFKTHLITATQDMPFIKECLKDESLKLTRENKVSLILATQDTTFMKECLKDESLGLNSSDKVEIIVATQDTTFMKECLKDESLGLNSRDKAEIIVATKDTTFMKECLKDESLGLNSSNKAEIIVATKDTTFMKECLKDESLGLNSSNKADIIAATYDITFIRECLKDKSLELNSNNKVDIIAATYDIAFIKECLKDQSLGINSFGKVEIILATENKAFMKECLKDKSLGINFGNKVYIIEATQDIAFMKECLKDESLELEPSEKVYIITLIQDIAFMKECLKDKSLGLNSYYKVKVITATQDKAFMKECLKDKSLGLDSYYKAEIIVATKDTIFMKECLKDESLGLNSRDKAEIIVATKGTNFMEECVKDESLGLDSIDKAKLIKATQDTTFIKECLIDQSLNNYIIKLLTTKEIINSNIELDTETIKKIIEKAPSLATKALLFSKGIDKEKLSALIQYRELNSSSNSIDSIMQNIYLSNPTTDELNFKIGEVYQLLTYKNVPEFLKAYKLFQLGNYANVENNNIASYRGLDKNSRNKIIMSDMFRISLDSNEKTLRNFAEVMKYGDKICEKLANSGISNLDNLTNIERAVLAQYVDTLTDIHNLTTDESQTAKLPIKSSKNIIEDLQKLCMQYGIQGIAMKSSLVMKDLFGNEIISEVKPEDILSYMDKKTEISIKRNKDNSDRLSQGNLKLEPGDYIKGISNLQEYLPSMLRYGLRGGEFNKDHSHSDATPLDLDCGYITKANIAGKSIDSEIIPTTISARYGRTYIILKNYENKFIQNQNDELPIKFTRQPEYWTNFQNNEDTNCDRYIRTGIGSLDVDYMVTSEWKQELGYEMAMAGVYIPVKDMKDKLIFSKEDYDKIREQMKGLSYYKAEPFEVDSRCKDMQSLYEVYQNLGGTEEKIQEVQQVVEGKPDDITIAKKKSVINYLKEYFASKGITVADELSGNLSKDEVELIDTGSTGRGTNVPGDGDFDLMIKHNTSSEILSGLREHVDRLKSKKIVISDEAFRRKNVQMPDGQTADIDVTIEKKDLELDYSTDLCVKDRLHTIQQQNPEYYNYVRANIIMAKNILKQIGLYKKYGSDGATEHGGFGGIGVETWILENGGSFAKAIETYLAATKDSTGRELSYKEFQSKYPIYDFGSNHKQGKSAHDMFSAFLSYDDDKGFGYAKQKFEEIQQIIERGEQSRETEKNTEVCPLRKSLNPEGLKKSGIRNF